MPINQGHEFFIQWHLTERCNLRCRHCYQTGGKTDELSLFEIQTVANEISEMLKAWEETYNISFSPSFNITGGEPFLRLDFFEILEEIGGRGIDIYILTNGTMINGRNAAKLAKLGVRGVQVSLEGPEEVHESIRGKGSFLSALRGVKNLLDAGLQVTLNATLSDINAKHFGDMIALASSLGVQRIGFSRLVPSGMGMGLVDKMIGKEKIQDIYKSIFSLQTDSLEIVTGDPVASQMSIPLGSADAGTTATAGCAAGISGLTFLPDGTITPCRRLFISIGNVRKDNLRELWATSEVLKSLRDRSRYRGKCGTCRRWAFCRGCRAIAYAFSRSKGGDDFLAEDPQCFIEDK